MDKPRVNTVSSSSANNGDLPDSARDEQHLQPEEATLDLPDVADIPGQENIVPPKMNAFADVTIASDDEEGVRVFGEDDGDEEDI